MTLEVSRTVTRPPTAKKAPTTRKSSLHRLRAKGPDRGEDLSAFVLPRYLDREGFTSRPVNKDGLVGLLVTGTIAPGRADWCDPLSILTGHPVAEENRTSLALFLVRTENSVYGITYGMGHLMIDPVRIDPGFGIEFAVRCLKKDRITKVRRQVMDARGRTDENSATSGEHIRGFGIEQFGEIVSQISGQIENVPLTFTAGSKRPAHVTGNDRSIKIHLGNSPAALLRDLQEIEEVCARPNPLPEFEFIAQVRPLSPKSEQAQKLDVRLDAMLGEGQTSRMALAVPSVCREHFEFAESFKVTLAGHAGQHAELDVDQLVAAVQRRPEGGRLRALREGRIQMFSSTDDSEANSGKVPVDHWFTAEVPDGVAHYFYWQGKWYEIGAEYLTVVEQRVADLLAQPASVTMPPWTVEMCETGERCGVPQGHKRHNVHDEDWYNKEVAAQDRYVLLDKNNVHTERLRGGGLEIADALGPQGQFICVKKAASSTAPLNHLFAQGRAGIETVRFDLQARKDFLSKVDKLSPRHALDRSFSSPTLVFGILLKNGAELTPDSLFAFAKISLLHTATALEGMGARLEVVSISRTAETGMARATTG
ncbi:DUF6119 family protein [Streptomyces sp. NPDC057682]|uniref:DUF6119 family protein n=1 Tax=Streptomyces sp. NPDC057682 TaxID=3346210 RepID=UPI0036BDC790